jgi:hypothetical protein
MTRPLRIPSLQGVVVPALTIDQWLNRKVDPPDNLLGELFSTTCRVLFSADTGLGKTMVGIAIAFAVRFQRPLMHWEPSSKRKRRPRVLFVDGEMPRDLMKERIALACEWFGVKGNRDGLFFLSREDFQDMPPLDEDEGQEWMDRKISRLKPDFIVFDNISALCSSIQREEESWSEIKPWSMALTRRRIGQLWLHHVGHDKSRSYGTKVREWQMDTVIVGKKVADTDALVSMELSFDKARRRKPSNASDFEDVTIELCDDQWVSRQPPQKRPASAEVVLSALRAAVAAEDGPVSEEQWREAAYQRPITKGKTPRAKQWAFNEGMKWLLKDGIVVRKDQGFDVDD